MRITYDQTYQTPLVNIGAELVRMIKDRDYSLIAKRFGYALAFDRPLMKQLLLTLILALLVKGDQRSSV